MENRTISEFWNRFLKNTNRNQECKYKSVYHFELNEKAANELLQLVLTGQKRATASSLNSFKMMNEKTPEIGDLSIITDWNGVPKGVVETTGITILPFRDMTFEIAKREGEDENLESWQKNHIKYYQAEGKELGYEFTPDLEILFEDFVLVYKEE